MSRKTGLKTRDVSKDHFSSGKNLNEPKFSRLVVRMLEGAQLLASDISTGKSDPVCFLWLGPCAETPVVEKLASEDHDAMFAKTVVCPTTVDPIWNEDVVFELQASDVNTMMDQKCVIFIRDEDIDEDGSKSYDELGMVEFTLKEIVSRGRALKSSIVLPATWYTLKKSPGMRRIDGRVKLTITLIFTPEDIESINGQLPPLASSDGAPSYTAGVGPLIQSHFKDPALMVSDPADMRVSTASSLRQSLSASGRRGTSSSPQRGSSDNLSVVSGMSSRAGGPKRPKSAHIVRRRETPSSLPDLNQDSGVDSDTDDRNARGRNRRPQSAPNRRYDIIQEEDGDGDDAEEAGGDAPAKKSVDAEGGADDEDEQELLVIPRQKPRATGATDELLAAPPAPGDQNFFSEIIGNAVSDGLGELAAFGAENIIDHAGDALHFAARQVGKGLKKVASAASDGGSKLPSVSATKAVGQRLATLSNDDGVRKALDMVDVPSVDLNDKAPQGGRGGGITLLRGGTGGAGAGGAAVAAKGGRPTDTSTPRSAAETGAGASQAKVNALFGENPLAARPRTNSNSSSSPHDEEHNENAAYDRYRNIHQQHGDLLSQYGLVAPMGDRDAAPGDEDGDKDAAVATASTDAADQRSRGGSPKEAAEQSTDDAAAVAAADGADADAKRTAKSSANAVVLPSRGSKQTDSNAALSTTDDAALLAGLDDGGAQGNATAVVRLLREMKLQREEMQQGMTSLARATEAGFRTLTQRIRHLEDTQSGDKPSSSSSSSRHAKRLLENGPSGGDEGGNEVLSDLEEDVTDANRRRRPASSSSSSAKGSGRGAKSLLKTAPASTQAASSDRGGGSGASNWKKAKTSAATASTFRQFRRQQQQLYTPVGGGSEIPLRSSVNGNSSSSAGPTIQMVYRDASGAIAAAPVAAPAASMATPLPLLDSSNAAAGATYGAQPPPSPVRFSYDNAPLGNLGASHNGPIGGSSLPPPINASLNRDFVEVLDRGSLEDVARLLESSAAKPEMLAISTRNRVYDIVATLLLQRKQYTERALIWVTALLRPNSGSSGSSSAFRELTPHTQRDLLQAVHHASTEPSKRGVLASLLYNQIDRAMSMG